MPANDVMPRHNKDKARFCDSLEWEMPIEWLDLVGLHKLDDGRLARIELETRGTSGNYPGFLVTVINKREGVVDSKYFRFDDYLPRDMDERQDNRHDYPIAADNLCFHVVAGCGFHWYIAVPLHTRPFCRAIEGYLEMFR